MAVCLLLFTVLPAFPAEKVIELGGASGWPALSVQDGITTGTGRFGYTSLQLATDARRITNTTDMLLSFEGGQFIDVAGRYTVDAGDSRFSSAAMMGQTAAAFPGGTGLVLRGQKGTMFGTENWSGSFVMEFWLCPSQVENGEMILNWSSSRNADGYPLYQMISATFDANRMVWNLTNIFSGYTGQNGEVVLKGIQTLIPGKWSHHALIYSVDTGLLEYQVNGMTEDLLYVTRNNQEGGRICPVMLGVPSEVEVCPQYTGLLDDFRILQDSRLVEEQTYRTVLQGKDFSRYPVQGGRIESQPLQVAAGSELVRIEAEINQPLQTAVQLFVRAGDNFYEWTDTFPAWIPVEPGTDCSGITGKYFQVAAHLYPDGAGVYTPSVTRIAVVYREVDPPLPPFAVNARAGNGYVELSWSASIDDVAGYYVYYGERPGEYLGRFAVEGMSPVAVGNVTSVKISGLQNGRIYYFAVASENKNGQRGNLSAEVYARPLIQNN